MSLNEMTNLKIAVETSSVNVEFISQNRKAGKNIIYVKIIAFSQAHAVPLFKGVIQFSSWKKMVVAYGT